MPIKNRMFKSLSVEVFAQWYASYTKLRRMCVGMTVERQICSETFTVLPSSSSLCLKYVLVEMRSSCGGAALWLFFPLNEIFTMKICAFKCVGNILSVSWCSAWSVSALYLSESEDSMTGSFQSCGIPAVPGSSGERVWKQEVKHLLFGWITWTIPEWAVRPTHLHLHPQGRWDSNSSRSSCLQI